jgi:hypothetical protein
MSYPYTIEIPHRIAGIPCVIGVINFGAPDITTGGPDSWEQGWDAEYDVLDSKGRPADWLAKKATDADDAEILMLIDDVRRDGGLD